MGADTFDVLFVCTGNICRSPTAERLLAHALRQRLGDDAASRFVVRSAGTGALVGEPIQPTAAALLTARGVDVAAFVARDLDRRMLDGADLVLALTRAHRSAAARLAPRILDRLFTLREYARLLTAERVDLPVVDAVARARASTAIVRQRRDRADPVEPTADDVPDPYLRDPAAYADAFALIDAAVEAMAVAWSARPTGDNSGAPE